MGEFHVEDPGFPEDLMGARDELLREIAEIEETGEDDGLAEFRAEVFGDPAALRAYLKAYVRTKKLFEA